jgi:hypothetical protein
LLSKKFADSEICDLTSRKEGWLVMRTCLQQAHPTLRKLKLRRSPESSPCRQPEIGAEELTLNLGSAKKTPRAAGRGVIPELRYEA